MRVAILGCGYVGLELGRQLVASGHEAVGVRRSGEGVGEVADAGLDAVRADVTDGDALGAVPNVDAVVFAASAGGRGADAARAVYVDGLRTVVEHFGTRERPPDRLVYASSTGVFGDHDGAWVDEETPLEPGDGKTAALVDAEAVALEDAPAVGVDPTVVRFGGIYGPGRYRVDHYVEGPVTAGYLNLVHRDDAAGILRFLLVEDRARGEVVVGVDDEPVHRWALADWLADRVGRDPPPKRTVEERLEAADGSATGRRLGADKRCSNATLRSLGYEFAYPTFREGFAAALSGTEA